MTEPLLQRIRNASVAVVHDNLDNSRWWMLRSLPALNYLVVDDFTYPTSWRQLSGGPQYDYLDYEYHVSSTIELDDPPPFGIITNRHYEEETPYSIQPLVRRYTIADAPLAVVTDSRDFTPEGGQRPLDQEQFADRIGAYSQVYGALERHYDSVGITLPLRDTLNLFIQDNAALYELVEGESLKRTKALFELLPETPYLPLYDVFSDIFSRKKEFGAVPLNTDDDLRGLGRWLRRRIEWDRGTGRDVAQRLNRAVADKGSTFDPSYARRSSAIARARSAAREIDHSKSPIHARYQAWLTRFQP